MVNSATCALSFINLFSWPINFSKYCTSLLWLATAANASCRTIYAYSSFYIHSRTKCSYYPHPICPKIKQTSCFSKGDWVGEYFLDKIRHNVWIAYSVPKSRMWYMIRYFSNRLISVYGFSMSPRKPSWEKVSLKFFVYKNWLNSSLVKGAAGYLVAKNLVPYNAANCLFLAFWRDILHVSDNSGHLLAAYFSKKC